MKELSPNKSVTSINIDRLDNTVKKKRSQTEQSLENTNPKLYESLKD